MILVSTIWFRDMPDIMVWPEIILVIALVSKIQDDSHFCKIKLYKLPLFSTERIEKIILMSTIRRFSGMPDILCDWKVH